jgi:hypothetical protein
MCGKMHEKNIAVPTVWAALTAARPRFSTLHQNSKSISNLLFFPPAHTHEPALHVSLIVTVTVTRDVPIRGGRQTFWIS